MSVEEQKAEKGKGVNYGSFLWGSLFFQEFLLSKTVGINFRPSILASVLAALWAQKVPLVVGTKKKPPQYVGASGFVAWLQFCWVAADPLL